MVVLAVAAHAVLLALLGLERPGLWLRPRPTLDRLAIDITLAPPLVFPPPPARKPSSRKPAPAAPSSQLPTPAAVIAESELPNLAKPVFRVWPRTLPGGVDWGGLDVGCDDPAAHHLSPEAKARCRQRWSKPSQQIAEIGPLIARDKQADFERRTWCRDKYELAGVPIGTADTFQQSLGYVPNFKDCPIGDR